jgi:hypothetical protein
LNSDLQLSLAFARVAIRALASLSPGAAATVGEALDQETDMAERLGAPIEVLEGLADLRADLERDATDDLESQRLERALVSAAQALSGCSVGCGEPRLDSSKSL